MILIDKPRKGWCHMVGTTIPELHAFAQKIGVKRCWFQNKRYKNQPHYDIRESMYGFAVREGAVPVDSQTIVKFLKTCYETTS